MNRHDLVSTFVNRSVSASGDAFVMAQQNGSSGRDDMESERPPFRVDIYTVVF